MYVDCQQKGVPSCPFPFDYNCWSWRFQTPSNPNIKLVWSLEMQLLSRGCKAPEINQPNAQFTSLVGCLLLNYPIDAKSLLLSSYVQGIRRRHPVLGFTRKILKPRRTKNSS